MALRPLLLEAMPFAPFVAFLLLLVRHLLLVAWHLLLLAWHLLLLVSQNLKQRKPGIPLRPFLATAASRCFGAWRGYRTLRVIGRGSFGTLGGVDGGATWAEKNLPFHRFNLASGRIGGRNIHLLTQTYHQQKQHVLSILLSLLRIEVPRGVRGSCHSFAADWRRMVECMDRLCKL